jgi:hypothetical protein
MNRQAAGDDLGETGSLGVITGLVVRDPQSATLTATIEGGWIRQVLSTGRYQLSRIVDTARTPTRS